MALFFVLRPGFARSAVCFSFFGVRGSESTASARAWGVPRTSVFTPSPGWEPGLSFPVVSPVRRRLHPRGWGVWGRGVPRTSVFTPSPGWAPRSGPPCRFRSGGHVVVLSGLGPLMSSFLCPGLAVAGAGSSVWASAFSAVCLPGSLCGSGFQA
jgi:hypothetical protein